MLTVPAIKLSEVSDLPLGYSQAGPESLYLRIGQLARLIFGSKCLILWTVKHYYEKDSGRYNSPPSVKLKR